MASVVSISTEQALGRVRDFAMWHPSYSLRDGDEAGRRTYFRQCLSEAMGLHT